MKLSDGMKQPGKTVDFHVSRRLRREDGKKPTLVGIDQVYGEVTKEWKWLVNVMMSRYLR